MKVVLAGLGVAGFSMYKKLINNGGLTVAVAEPDAAMKSKLEGQDTPFYLSFEEALQEEKPDFVVNVTPPMVHTAINNRAFDLRLPVLCEKPISFDYGESLQVVERAVREGIPFMIAENYRRFPYIRRLKTLLEEGIIGRMTTIDVQFYRYHHTERKYTVSLLDDIAIHHLDMIRYLTGREGSRIFARNFNPIGSWSSEPADINLNFFLELDNGIAISYTGSIASRGPSTEWGANWRIEGTEGVVQVTGKQFTVYRTDGSEPVKYNDFSELRVTDTLTEFLSSLQEGRESESSGRDYLKTQALAHYANESSRSGKVTDIVLPAW
ncbi:Gfo/Idh/MocA family protein [Paenibacillus allorhizosphaerae]|uniref:D-apiose dehydrogenase n=1 Tax=Paenibacillus allorhizosphaerae TaxID=2849866 RepID=A0ABM8VT00_9BACL|nr:Gfo/Idh/MocA family oxidoreductase [Paenibacillus allorhizosphaerae]CAG7657225.1 D-apiose dehydrogenase [Paenibacillus allorhizosphaerae]